MSQKNELLGKINLYIQQLISNTSNASIQPDLLKVQRIVEKGLNSEQDWKQFKIHFENVHEDFFKRLQKDFPNLKPNTLKLCAFLKMRLSTKQISVLTNTAPDSIIKARYRLRKKLNISKSTHLEEFLNRY
jgi:hypothetical protein